MNNNFGIEFEITKKQEPMSKIKIFIISSISIFLMVVLQHLGVTAPKININVNSVQKADVMKTLLPKIQTKPNNIHIQSFNLGIAPAYAGSDPDNAKAYEVLDMDTSKIVSAKDNNVELPIASLTKIMTSVVALDVSNPLENFIVTKKAETVTPTRIGVIAGQELNTDELLHAMLMTSANDAAQVIADGIDKKYGTGTFIRLMNEKAKFIGLTNTHFANPEGFDSSKNYSTASDLAILADYALTNYPQIKEIASKDYYFIASDQRHKQFDLYNWNGLLGVYPNVYGLKIGNTDNAGYTDIVVSKRGDKNLLSVLLGAPGIVERDLWSSELLDLGYQTELNLSPVRITRQQLLEKYATWHYWN